MSEEEMKGFLTDVESEDADPLTHPLGLHMVQLLLAEPTTVNPDELLTALHKRCGVTVERIDDGEAALMFAHPDHMIAYDKGNIPAQTIVWTGAVDEPLAPAVWEPALQHLYDWDRNAARAACEQHRMFLLITDMMAAGLPPVERMELFHNSLLALLDVVGENCLALHWMRSGVLVNPATYRTSKEPGPRYDPIYPAISVRLFPIQSDKPGNEYVMDTLGMTAFALRDLQIIVRDIEPGRVAAFLNGMAHYLFDHGDVIGDGHTVQGIGPDKPRWRCQHAPAFVGPEREVLNIDTALF